MRPSSEAMKGLTPLLVLDALAQGELSGIEIVRRIRERSASGFEIPEGTIYPLLYRLETKGTVRGRWREGSGRRRQRVYALTRSGGAVLASERTTWLSLIASLSKVLDPPASTGAHA